MALVSEPIQQRNIRRIWKTSGSKLNWVFLLLALIITGSVYWLYRAAVATQAYPGPYNDPLREFGIVSFVLVLITFAYTLRRRFVRRLPGMVQNWLWLHIWFGTISIFIACMHNNFQGITYDISFMQDRLTEAAYGTSALYALLLLVFTGIVGRLLDIWQSRVITAEANTNGVGIIRSVEERLFELSLAVDRWSAGKSIPFKQYCAQALATPRQLPSLLPVLASHEVDDFQCTYGILSEKVQLEKSLQRQKRAHLVIRTWRYVHIPVACIALLVISYHSIFELWKMFVLKQ